MFNLPRLGGMMLGGRQTSRGQMGLGATMESRAMVLGFETSVKVQIIEWDPPHALTAAVTVRPMRSCRLRETYETAPGGTRLDRSMDFELRPAFRLIWPIIRPLVVRRWNVATKNIKRIIESEPSDAPASIETGPESRPLGLYVRRTLMFTDVVGSTALVELVGDEAWRDLRRWHDKTLRAIFERHGGRELDHAGDGFCIAFDSAARAIDAAVAVQRTLIDHRRSTGFAPSIRIGIHSGDVKPDGATFTGSALHVASRVAGSADGGQILATDATVREAGVVPASPATELSLRGVTEPVSVAVIPW
jgi:class 3 adenylate cyclase